MIDPSPKRKREICLNPRDGAHSSIAIRAGMRIFRAGEYIGTGYCNTKTDREGCRFARAERLPEKSTHTPRG
jgi:hypothetical protein